VKRYARGLLVGVSLALLAGCASSGGDAPPPARPAAPPRPEFGGPATGVLDTGSNGSTTLSRAYVVAMTKRKTGAIEYHVIVSDGPVSQEVLDRPRLLPDLGAKGRIHAIELVLDASGKLERTLFHDPDLPAGLSVAGPIAEMTLTGFPGGPIRGRVRFDDPKEFSWKASAEVEAPIYRPPPPPGVDPSLPPRERARAELRASDVPFTDAVFLDKVFDGDLETVELFLLAGQSPNTRSGRGSALDDAISQKRVDVARTLIEAGADVNEKKAYDQSLLMDAIGMGNPELVALLLDKGADPNAANTYRVTPLMVAAERGALDAARRLVAKGAKVNARTPGGGSALMNAVLRGYEEIVTLLIDAGADVARDKKVLLEIARREKHKDVERIIQNAKPRK